MYKKFIIIFIVLFLLFSFTLTHAEENDLRYITKIFNNVEIKRDIVYKTVKDRTDKLTDQKLDIYQPKNDPLDKRPLIVWIHGGGFVNGSKENMEPRCVEFAKMGYVTATINYRLSASYTKEFKDAINDAVEDARSAIDWLRKNASDYKIDTNNIFVGGSSAGGITSIHLGYEDTGWDKSGIRGIINLWGALFNLNVVDPDDPPVIIIHGMNDNVVPFKMSLDLVKKLKENNIYFEFYPVKGVGHGVPPTSGLPYNYVEALFIYSLLD
jgi:acetyl esterase/lipase